MRRLRRAGLRLRATSFQPRTPPRWRARPAALPRRRRHRTAGPGGARPPAAPRFRPRQGSRHRVERLHRAERVRRRPARHNAPPREGWREEGSGRRSLTGTIPARNGRSCPGVCAGDRARAPRGTERESFLPSTLQLLGFGSGASVTSVGSAAGAETARSGAGAERRPLP